MGLKQANAKTRLHVRPRTLVTQAGNDRLTVLLDGLFIRSHFKHHCMDQRGCLVLVGCGASRTAGSHTRCQCVSSVSVCVCLCVCVTAVRFASVTAEAIGSAADIVPHLSDEGA